MIENSVAVPAVEETTREDRAMILFETYGDRIERLEDGNTYLVPSQDGERVYRVQYGKDEECQCPDHEHRGSTCVHLLTVGILNARRRGDRSRRILQEAVERYENEMLDDEERMLLLDRIKKIRRQMSLEAVDAHYTGLERG